MSTEAGVLTYFAGAEVCSPPAKLWQHTFVLQTTAVDHYIVHSTKGSCEECKMLNKTNIFPF